MKKNLNLLGGLHKSQDLLLLLTRKGLSRQKAYSLIQKCAMDSWNNRNNFSEILLKNKEIKKYISANEIKKIIIKNDKIEKIAWIFKNKVK